MNEIGCLLSEFKSKFASIQQKYANKAKSPDYSNSIKCETNNIKNPYLTFDFHPSATKGFMKHKTCPGS
mgnify:CR=1 FL=1